MAIRLKISLQKNFFSKKYKPRIVKPKKAKEVLKELKKFKFSLQFFE